ncbi:MAG: multidrug ABC transporter permease [Candidatus Lokiarchaeota archaeon]|nr:multidrug ABC transporter permease [Candidatus Lokiarchaeota archaeon]
MLESKVLRTKMNYSVVWILAKRELIGYWRSKSRIISSLAQGLLFLFVFGAGFSSSPVTIQGIIVNPRAFVASGMAAIVILFTGIFGGMSIFRDKMFGFMKELLVAPVSRGTLMLGRTLGVALQTVIQVVTIIILSVAIGYFGYDLNLIWRIMLIIPVSLLASLGVVGIGLIISTRLSDMQSFGLIQTFIVMPMFWLSGALIAFPSSLQIILMLNPFTYSVDLFRLTLLGVSYYPFWLDLTVTVGFGALLIFIGARSFNKMEVSQ